MEEAQLLKNRDVEHRHLEFGRQKLTAARYMVGDGIKQINDAKACATYQVFRL